MELPADTQFLVINLEHCIPSSANQVVQNETTGFREGSDVIPPTENPSGEAVTTKDKQGASETSEQCSTVSTLHNSYSGYYGEIFSYLMTKSFPDGASESLKRMLKRSSQYYCVIDGVLHYGHKNPKKVVSDKEEQRKILARSHIEEGTGVHRGAKKMYEFINSTVFWRYLYVDITNYIKECTKCVDFGHENDVNNAELAKHDWPKSLHIWEKVCVQILGPYPKTANRNEFVVTIVDPVSQWIVAQPIAFDGNLASQVACLIFKTFCDFGFTECTINSVPLQISSDILSKLKKYENCLYKVTAALGVPVDASQICNLVKCQDEITDCVWLNELFSTWVQNNPCTWDKDLDEFLFEFRALPKNGAPSPFRAMFNRRPVRCTEANKENVLHQNLVPVLSKRRKLQGSLMKCRHCDEVFTSKMSFRIHQRRHTEDAKRRGLMEGEDLFNHVGHENIEDYGPKVARRSANQNTSDPANGNVANSWKRLKKITNKGSRTQVGKPQLREEVQKQLRANAVAAVKNIILATKDAQKKRGKYQKYPQDVQEEMARYAIQHGILKTTRHFSERLSVRVCHSTIRNIVKLHCCFTPQLKDEIGRFAAGFGVEAASRHFSERLGREVRQGLVRKFKKHYVARLSDTAGKTECGGHTSTVSGKHRNSLDEKLRKEVGKHACEVGISSTVKFFLEKHSLNLKESLIRKLRKQYLERNKPHANGTALPEVYQNRQYANSEEAARTYQGNSNVVHAFYANQVYHSTSHIRTNDSLLPQQQSSLPFNTISNTTNSTGLVTYQQVPPSTTSVVVSQDSLSVSIYQQPEQAYSSVTHEGHVIQGSAVPVSSSSSASVPPQFHFQPSPLTTASDTVRNNEAALQTEHHIQQVSSSSAITTETTLAAVHVVPSLPQKQQTQGDSSSSLHSLQPQAVVIHQSHHSNTVESSYPATVVQAVGDKMTVLSALDACGASAMADRDDTYTLTTCIPTGEKSMYKPKTFHFPVSHLDTVAMAVCRDDGQTVNDVIITIVPSSENDKASHKSNAAYQDCQKVSSSTFLLEKDLDHVYQEQLIKQQAHVIPVQLQQHIEHFHENQSRKQDLQQEQPLEEHLKQHKNHVSEPQVLHLQQQQQQQQQPLLQEEQVKTSHKYKQQNSQYRELPQRSEYQQNQQLSHQTKQQLFQLQQQSDCPTPQTHQHRQLFLLQTHLPQEQPQKQTHQRSQHYSQQMQRHVLQQPVQLQEPQESVQHLKKQHLYRTQQQLFLLQPHLNSDHLQKPVHQQNQLQLLEFQEQPLKEHTKDSLQQQKQKLHGHQHKLIQVQQLVNCQQSQESVDEQKQQPHQLQQPVFQLQLQLDQEQQTSEREQNQEHSHQSQLYLSQEQAQKSTQQQKQQYLHQPQHEVLQLQQKFSQEQPLQPVHQQKQQHLHQSHQVIQLQHQLVQEQMDMENQKHLHQSEQQVLHLQQQLVQEQPQELTHQEKHQYLHQPEHQILQLQQQLTQEQPQAPTDEKKKQHLHQSEHQVLKLQQHLDQEQVHKPSDKGKQYLHQSRHKALQLQQQFDQEQLQEPTHKEEQQHLHQSQHQVLLLQQELDQGQPCEPTHQEKQQHLHQSQHQVLRLEQHLDHEEPQQSVHQEKEQSLHHSEHQVLQLQQQLNHAQPLESVHQEKQLLHLSQHHILQLQKHLVQDPVHQGKQQNFHQSEQQALQLQQQLGHKQQEVMYQEKQNFHQSHHEVLQLQQQELTHQDKQQHLDQSHQKTFHLQHQPSQERPQRPSHKEKQQFLHQQHQETFHLQQQLTQEQPQESAHQENEQQLQLQQLQQPHRMLQLEHELHHEQLKRQANQQEQQHLFNLQQQDNPEPHSLHQQPHHSQQNQPNHPEKEQSQQEVQQPTEVGHQNSYQERQSEVLHYMKLACTFEEEESTDDPDEMVIYVSDAADSNREDTVKEQKNNTANSRKETNRNKSKAVDSTSHKRGNYTLYSPELRAELGKYAAEHGNQRAREYFRDILGHDVPESTIRGLRDKYILKCHVNSNAPGGINSVTSLGYSPRGRPLRLGKYDDIVKDCIQDLMQSGEKISKFLAIATAKQVLMQYEPELLVENGGSIKLTSAWAKSFLRRIGVQHDS